MFPAGRRGGGSPLPYVTNSGRGILDYLFGADDQPFTDSWRDQWSQGVGNAAGILGMDPNRTASTTRRVIDFVPGVGDAISLNDAKRDFDAGNYGSAAINAGTGILGLVPGGGDAAALAGKGLLAAIGGGIAKKGLLGEVGDGIRAYHGSPYSFDKFEMSKIGTGEGAQAYGHGLYFAESEDVAQGYKQALQRTDTQPFEAIGLPPREIQQAVSFVKTTDSATPEVAARDFANWTGKPVTPELVQAFAAAKKPGHMYEVNINAAPEQFLDWDAPLSAQPEAVHEGLRKLWGSSYERRISDPYNSHAQDIAARTMDPVNGRSYTEELRQAGIPGIKYLDQGSRGAGDGTRNYVVFDQNLINIVRKYGIAGAVGAGLISQQMADQMQAQGAI